jgi:putative DNA primase/helicase
VPTAATWLITGNHLEFIGDLTSRVLLSALDPEVEHPEARPFKRDLAAYVTEHRGTLLAAALTIPLAYLTAGEPITERARLRFCEWDRLVRRPLLWLDAADPLTTQAELQAADPVREGLLGVLRAWRLAFGEEPTTVARATQAAMELNREARPDLYDALHAVAGEKNGAVSSRGLGRYLKRNARRIEESMRIEVMEEDRLTHRQRFRVSGVTGVSGVSVNPTRENAIQSVRSETDADNAGNATAICRRCAGEGCEWCRS